jgi:23S rRNA (cytidine1920-2'-O)/16S rRNA (cytidine1409-2'-O)-methyltransferase
VTRRRALDRELVRRGLVGDVPEAEALVAARRVLVGGAVADSTRRQVAPDEPLVVEDPPDRYVSRAGHKLEAAIVGWDIAISGRHAVDVGASTGGFTDCLLQHGAASVAAIDVGSGQLDQRLRDDRRVTPLERTNVRDVTADQLARRGEVVVVDVAFTSVARLAESVLALAEDAADVVVLVKPQFEATRHEADVVRGVIVDAAVRRRVLEEVAAAFESAGAGIMGAMPCPLRGAAGNVELLLHARAGAPPMRPALRAAMLDAAIATTTGGGAP